LAPFYLKPKNRPQVPPDKLQQIKDIGYSLNQTLTRQKHLGFTWLHLKLLEILLILFEEIPEDKSLNLENSDSIDRVCKAVRLVFNNNKYISTKEAARKCGINRNLFAKLFKQIMGLSFKEFGLRYRVSGAAEELLQTDKPVKTVAFEWGFTDTSHLYRYFIKYYNCNPTSYRLHKKR
jgi:AraC-like DNA-binding protein